MPPDSAHSGAFRVWLSGSGRGGTTFLSNLVTGAGRVRQILEPLHPARVELPVTLDPALAHPGSRPYLRPGGEYQAWRAWIDAIYRGDAGNRWTRYGHFPWSHRPRIFLSGMFPHHKVVKEVRSNLMLGWLSRQMSLKVIFLIRHPCATVSSQVARGWEADPSRLLEDSRLTEDFLGHLPPPERLLSTRLRRAAARWAIENLIPLRQARDEGLLVVTYEELVLDTTAAAGRIFEYLGWPLDPATLRRVLKRADAPISGLKSRGPDPWDLVAKWKKSLSEAECREILDVCHAVGVDLYGDGLLPVTTDEATPRSDP